MRFSARRTLVGAAVILAGIVGLNSHSTDAAEAVSASDFNALVDQDAKNILLIIKKVEDAKADAKKRTESNAAKSIPANAMIIAHLAQQRITGSGADDGKWATLRDTALKVALTASDKKTIKNAAADAKLLSPDIKVDPKASTKLIKLEDMIKTAKFDLEMLMQQYKPPVVGGYGIENEIKALADKDKKAVITPDKASQMMVRIIAIADYCDVLEPTKGFGAKAPKKEWDASNKDTREAAAGVMKAVNSKNAKDIQAAFTKLDAACTRCHNTFK